MLLECTIRNFAVIESVHVRFHRGFHVLTGETGAGKSMIIDALSLIAGGRGSAELVRHGSSKAEIECVFELEASHPVHPVLERIGVDMDDEEYLIIRREITNQGKSTARINGQMVNLSMLREVGEWLVNIHGQHEHQSLLKVEQHIQLLDAFGGNRLVETKRQYTEAYRAYQNILSQIQELEQGHMQQLQMLDLYRFQVEELSAAGLVPGEDEALLDEKRILANAENLMQNTSGAYESLYGGKMALESVSRAVDHLEEIVQYDPVVLTPLLEQIRNAYYQLEDAAYQLRDYREGIDYNADRLDEIEQRLDLIANLKRKYGNTTEEMLSYLAEISEQLNRIEHRDEMTEQLKQKAQEAKEQVHQLGSELSKLRKQAAEQLADSVSQELQDLHMEKTKFEINIEQLPEPSRDGLNHVEFMIAPNPGEPLRPLHKIASGGELSRIMLAMKSIFAAAERIPVLVFDEVDTGVSGRAAQAIAEKLAKLSRTCQVFSITHLPQVACMADTQYLISKQIREERTFTSVSELEGQSRVSELARMLGGVKVTETTEEHAQEMLDMASQKKERWHHLQL